MASARVYAANGRVYTCSALAWLWIADRSMPATFDLVGLAKIVVGCGIVIAGGVR